MQDIIEIFESARKLYPGTKRGYLTELDNFRKHRDWKDVLLLLKPAIENQIEWRKCPNGEFRPQWKNFKVWINQRCWEESHYVKPKQEITTPTYVLPRPNDFITVEERRAIRERMMKTDPKTAKLFNAGQDHIVDVNKKVANLQALGLTVKESVSSNSKLEVGTIKPDLNVDHISQVGKKESKWPEYTQAVRELKAEREKK